MGSKTCREKKTQKHQYFKTWILPPMGVTKAVGPFAPAELGRAPGPEPFPCTASYQGHVEPSPREGLCAAA